MISKRNAETKPWTLAENLGEVRVDGHASPYEPWSTRNACTRALQSRAGRE
jgi:hypothetical protein